MIYVVIGQSGAGKTTFCRRLLPEPYSYRDDIIPITIASNGLIGFGKYGIGKRTEGTDTLPYNAQNAIIRQLQKCIESGEDALIEGDRINNTTVMDYLMRSGEQVKMYLLFCSLNTSMKRLRAAGSKITPVFVKTTKTKSKRIYMLYKQYFDAEAICTEEKSGSTDN